MMVLQSIMQLSLYVQWIIGENMPRIRNLVPIYGFALHQGALSLPSYLGRRELPTTSRGTSSGLYAHDIYTDTFGGTSAATPMVSGVVALMRQVNPSLSWRDVKLILANSARQNDLTDDGWMQGAVKYGLSSDDADAQYHFNHKYGFGVVNAEKAVEMAEGWINLPAAAAYTEIRNRNLNLRLTTDNRVINREISGPIGYQFHRNMWRFLSDSHIL